MVDHTSDGDEHLRLVKTAVAAQFPSFGTAGGIGRLLREFHPVVRLRVLNSYALPARLARTPRKLRSVAAGSGVFPKAPAAMRSEKDAAQ